jgi:hypothetical protein
MNVIEGTRYGSWLWRYAKRWKVAGSIPDHINVFFSIYLILPAAQWLWD